MKTPAEAIIWVLNLSVDHVDTSFNSSYFLLWRRAWRVSWALCSCSSQVQAGSCPRPGCFSAASSWSAVGTALKGKGRWWGTWGLRCPEIGQRSAGTCLLFEMKPTGPAGLGKGELWSQKDLIQILGPYSDSGPVLPSSVALDKFWHKISTLLNIWGGGHISVNMCEGAYRWKVLPRCVNEWIWDNEPEAASAASSTWLVCSKGWVLCSGDYGSGLDSPTRKRLIFCQG